MTERSGPALHGWLIIDKPVGIGSTQVVGAVKRALREGAYAKVKVGHGGTLDPLASGVLPVALGEATKLAGRMLDASKVYDFTIRFGTETDGLDAEGTVVATSDVRPTLAGIEAVLAQFTGPIAQIPPAYSAIKIDGKRAYDLARAGAEIAMAARAVTVHALHALVPSCEQSRLQHSHTAAMDEVTLTAHVSKGTYIRSLARDIANALGTVGHVSMLRRTRAGAFTVANAISLDILADAATRRGLEAHLLPLEAGLDGIPALSLAPGEAQMIRHGGTLSGQSVDDGTYLATSGNVPIALVTVLSGHLSVLRGFNL
jgi:tRNA pseudouridine55 synthase